MATERKHAACNNIRQCDQMHQWWEKLHAGLSHWARQHQRCLAADLSLTLYMSHSSIRCTAQYGKCRAYVKTFWDDGLKFPKKWSQSIQHTEYNTITSICRVPCATSYSLTLRLLPGRLNLYPLSFWVLVLFQRVPFSEVTWYLRLFLLFTVSLYTIWLCSKSIHYYYYFYFNFSQSP